MARGPTVVPFPAPWRNLLRTSRGGGAINDLANMLIALRNDPDWTFAAAFDQHQQEIKLLKAPPIAPGTEPGAECPRFAVPEDFTRLQEWLQRTAIPKAGRDNVEHAFELFARERLIHPLRDWLNTRPDAMADGRPIRQPVLENWLCYALDVPNDAYHREIGRRFVISMVARIMEPGCQCDYMLVLEGPQGELKSQFCRMLAGQAYFSDHIPDLKGDQVRVSMHLRGKWLIEVSELAAFSRVADVETLKAFITRQEEIYTPKYGRKDRREPRQCVFVGTTNDDEWIKDPTGARRFWPVKVREVNLGWLGEYRDQLFAEAVEAYLAGEPWWPDRNFERRVIAPHQEKRQVTEEWTDRVLEIAAGLTVVTIAQIWDGLGSVTRGGDLSQLDTAKAKRIAGILKKDGYSKVRDAAGRKIWQKPE